MSEPALLHREIAFLRPVRLLNIEVDDLGMEEALDRLERGAVFTPNMDHLAQLQQDADFVAAYRRVEYPICDGSIVRLLGWLFGLGISRESFRGRFTGTDLFEAYVARHGPTGPERLFIVGGIGDTARKAVEAINARVGRDFVVGGISPAMGFPADGTEETRVLEAIAASGATVVAVGLGAPKQEKWIDAVRDRLPSVKLWFAVGSAIDFNAGTKPRAPRWMQRLCAEWLFRLLSEPRRLWRRYLLRDVPVALLLLRQRLGLYRPVTTAWSSR